MRYTLLIATQDKAGLVYQISRTLYEAGANIERQDEYVDRDNGLFFMRTCFVLDSRVCHTERSEVSPNNLCHTEGLARSISNNNKEIFRYAQNDKDLDSSLVSLAQNDNELAQLFHYDLFGKRKGKYAFLQSNTLESIARSEIAPKAPFYLFIPQNEALRSEYEKGISVKDIFKLSNVGITSGKDSFCISKSDSQESLQELKNNITKFMKLDSESARKEFNLGDDDKKVWQIQKAKNDLEKTKNDSKHYIKIHYRPFDFRWTYYTSQSGGFLGRPRYEVMKHFLPSDSSLRDLPKASRGNPQNENVGFVYKRGFPNSQSGHCFATDTIIDFRSWSCAGMQGGDYISPLYLIESDSRIENFTPQFRAFVDKKYGESYAPEVILGYIYAILYHKDYREKYIDFLKIDFPKIPFVESKETFLALSALGRDLIDLHLMRVDLSGESVGEALFSDLSNKNEKIEKIAYNAESKGLFVNSSLYFDNVSAEVWEYKIGGYAVLDKYLKSHKGESIDYAHFERVIKPCISR